MLMMGCRVGRKPGDIRVNKTEYSSSIGVANNGDQNGGDKENDCSEGGGGKDNKLLTDLKYSLNSYFGAETRITKGGERFQVINRADRKSQIGQCLDFSIADFWSSRTMPMPMNQLKTQTLPNLRLPISSGNKASH